ATRTSLSARAEAAAKSSAGRTRSRFMAGPGSGWGRSRVIRSGGGCQRGGRPNRGRGGPELVSWRERFAAAPERFGAAGAVTRAEGRAMRTITTVALGVLLVVAAGASAQEAKEGKKDTVDAKKLIGKWEPKDKKDNVTLEFTKDGKLLLSVEAGGKTNKLEGTYKLDGNKL